MNPYAINIPASALPAQSRPKIPVPREQLSEISWSESDVIQSYIPYGNNPDPVARIKGLEIYRAMMEDDQIKVCVDLRKQARLSTPWEILPGAEDNPQAKEMAEFVEYNLRRIRGTFEDRLYKIYSAIEYGFSISEKIFEVIPDGKYKGMIGLADIKSREPFNYDFKVDAHGNMLGLVYIGATPGGTNNAGAFFTPGGGFGSRQNNGSARNQEPQMGTLENPFPPEKFIIYSYNMEFSNWYGRSDLLAAFRHYQAKKHVLKFWNIYLERYASPFLIATYKRDVGLTPKSLEAVDDFIRNLSARQGMRVSDAITITPIQFSASNTDIYEKSIEASNRFMAHALLFPNLMGFTDQSKTGSYSLGQKHYDAFVWVLEKLGRDTTETIVGEQIIKQLIDYNYPDVDDELYPKFSFLSIEEESIKMRADILNVLKNSGLINPEEEWIRDFLTLPQRDPNLPLVDPAANLIGPDGNPMNPSMNKPPFGNKNNFPPQGNKKPNQDQAKPDKPDAKKPIAQKMQQFKERAPDEFEKKMRVKEFKAAVDSADEAMFKDASAAIIDMRDTLINFVYKKKVITEGDANLIKNIPLNVGALKNVFLNWYLKIYLDSKLRAFEEFGRAGADIEVVRKFADQSAPMEDWIPLPPAEAMDFFARKVTAKIVDKDGKKKIVDLTSGTDLTYIRNKAFTIAGVVRDDILNSAKNILLNGIKRVDEPGTVKDLKDMFNRYLDQGIEVDGELTTPHRLNTIVRTNVSEAINEGRAAMIQDPDVGDFVQFWQYTAVIDDRTTDYCLCMDQKKFRVEDLDSLKPPSHFNCRSFVVPITQFEVNDLKSSGRGVQLDEPCFDRAPGFDEKREPVQITNDPLDPRGVKEQLSAWVIKCPYKGCSSGQIQFDKAIYNVGEYHCDDCGLPFRVSVKGDIYLYDAGREKWERVSMGLQPSFFKEGK